ncbi:hypothetical protein ZPAH1_orf00047 [Aeromonas phage ZPAH1]|nr:hypothetical protein ZPAH1_orf00047 [Aeromonas phage ZPAH1]
MKKVIASLLMVVVLSGCTDADGARNTLSKNGYTDIHITGYSFLSCDEKDFFSTGFQATNIASGMRVEGAVCSGLFFKNSTIRFD